MKEQDKNLIEDLLPGYFSTEISNSDRLKVDQWRNESQENQKHFEEMKDVWESGEILGLMQQFNAKRALERINKRLELYTRPTSIWQNLQKIAAILLLPLIAYSTIVTIGQLKNPSFTNTEETWQEVNTTTGMHSELVLPDGTHVWLNSETILEYPLKFNKIREINLKGEAFFEVKKDIKHPFIVNTGKINIEVLGTSFNVANYTNDNQTEIVLKSGKVNLFTGNYLRKKNLGFLVPNQRAEYNSSSNELLINNVSVEKYTAWKDGVLMFIDDPMDVVANKLNRWFNVNIILEDKELKDYIYRATFQDETLTQILDLLKLSAPINYTIHPRELLPNGKYSKRKVILKKR